jgi:hypothetical protein
MGQDRPTTLLTCPVLGEHYSDNVDPSNYSVVDFTISLDDGEGAGVVVEVRDSFVNHFVQRKLNFWDVAYFTYLLSRLGDDTQTLMVFKNGVLSKLWLLKGDVGSVAFSDVPGVKDWYRVEMHGKPSVAGLQILLYGRMIALTNPIYFGFQN